jgi:hypothetical protein
MAKFSSVMDKKYPPCGFAPFTQRLRHLEGIIETATGPCLSSDQIYELEKFSEHLSSNQCFIDKYFTHLDFRSKLHQFWNFRQSIVNTGRADEIILWRLADKDKLQATLNELKDSLERTRQVFTQKDLPLFYQNYDRLI